MIKIFNFSNPYSNSKSLSYKPITFLAALIAIIEYSRLMGFLPFQFNPYIILPFILIGILYCGITNKFFLLTSYFILLLYIPINLIITNPSPIFYSWPRYILFAIIFLLVSPIFQNLNFRLFRFQLFKGLIWLVLPLSCLTLPCYILGINFFKSNFGEADYHEAVGRFSGLFTHSMILGPVSAICTIFSIWLCVGKERKNIHIILALLCACATLLSASRAAVIGMVLGGLTVIFFDKISKRKKIRKLFNIIVILIITLPLWQGALHGITIKNESNDQFGEFGSRTVKFAARISEISSSPIVGVGFASIDPKGGDKYDPDTGIVEPGSSWLGIMSMTGIIGLSLVIYYFIKAFRILLFSKSVYSHLLLGLLVLFSIHLLFEGYIFAGGSVQCFIIWLIIGISTDIKFTHYEKY